MRRRIYADEAPIYANEAPHKGRSRKGKPIIRARSRYATKYTLHVYAKKDRVVHWDLSDKNADTKEIERVAVDAAAQMDDTLIWDRLGRSGRALHPIHQHYSPAVKEIQGTWRVKSLPQVFNPIKLLFNVCNRITSNQTFFFKWETVVEVVREYMDETPSTLSGLFSARANGK